MTGVTVIDVVEGELGAGRLRCSADPLSVTGSALEALSGMGRLVAAQPKGFPSVENAIEWQ